MVASIVAADKGQGEGGGVGVSNVIVRPAELAGLAQKAQTPTQPQLSQQFQQQSHHNTIFSL